MIQVGLFPHKCKECGKKFEARAEYAYKLHKYKTCDEFIWFCSYRCLRAYEGKHSRKKKPSQRDREILDLLAQGVCPTEIGKRLGMTYQAVAYVRDKWTDKIA